MIYYSASVLYTPQKIRDMEKIIHQTFGMKSTMIRWLICFILILYGAYRHDGPGIILLGLGCIIIGLGNATGRYRASQTIEALGGKDLQADYHFMEHEFSTESSGTRRLLSYSKLIRLVRTADRLYLFESPNSVYVIDNNTIIPAHLDAFLSFMTQKTGMKWTSSTGYFNLNIQTLIYNSKNTKKGRK